MEKKLCPLKRNVINTKGLTVGSYLKAEEHITSFGECEENSCGWWNKETNKCAVCDLSHIAKSLWDKFNC